MRTVAFGGLIGSFRRGSACGTLRVPIGLRDGDRHAVPITSPRGPRRLRLARLKSVRTRDITRQ